jgi:hypothetical protein
MRYRIVPLIVLLFCCCKTTGNWYWVEGTNPPAVYKDSIKQIRYYTTFTAVLYSDLDHDAALIGRQERALLFRLVNEISDRGYRYVENIDSADFIVTQRVTDMYKRGEGLSAQLGHAPGFVNVMPFLLSDRSFNNDVDYPFPCQIEKLDRSHPKLDVIVYDAGSRKVIEEWINGAVVNDCNYRSAVQNFIWDFGHSLSASPNGFRLPFGHGMAGMGLSVWSLDGDNFWPGVTNLDDSFPAKLAGIKLSDMLLSVDGTSFKNFTTQEVYTLLKSEPGRILHLIVWRWPGRIIPFTITTAKRK